MSLWIIPYSHSLFLAKEWRREREKAIMNREKGKKKREMGKIAEKKKLFRQEVKKLGFPLFQISFLFSYLSFSFSSSLSLSASPSFFLILWIEFHFLQQERNERKKLTFIGSKSFFSLPIIILERGVEERKRERKSEWVETNRERETERRFLLVMNCN